MRPVSRTRRMTMFHRVVVDVRDVIFQITFIADRVFPEAALPHHVFTKGVRNERRIAFRQRTRKPGFDQRPRRRIIGIIVRHRPDRVQVIGHHTDRHRGYVPCSHHRLISGTQIINMINQSRHPPISQRNRKEVSPTRNKIAPIHNHVSNRKPVAVRSEARQGNCSTSQRGEVPSADVTGTRTRFASPGYRFASLGYITSSDLPNVRP